MSKSRWQRLLEQLRRAVESAAPPIHAPVTAADAEEDRPDTQAPETRDAPDRLPPGRDTGAAVGRLAPLGRDTERSPRRALELAQALYDRSRVDQALALFERLTQQPETAIEAHLALADHLRQEVDLEAALAHYEAVLALDFTQAKARKLADQLRERLQPPAFSGAPTIVSGNEAGINRRYLMERELGSGGGGRVYLALDRQLDRPVAVKVLHRSVTRRASERTQLFCEARLAASLRHPQIITIYDLDEQSGLISMEHCEGGTLQRLIEQGPLAPAGALRLLAEMCDALALVHRLGIVHRDVKPANWLFRRRAACAEPLVLTDFGIAGAVASSGSASAAGGTVAYMAPEQLRGGRTGPQTDLYPCGLIALELLLGAGTVTSALDVGAEPVWSDGNLWRRLGALLPEQVRADVVDLLRGLVLPEYGARLSDARACADRAADLAAGLDQALERCRLLAELQRLAGPEPRAPEIDRWLRAQASLP